MYLIVGLGNPGNEYEYTRHNIGFRIVDFFAMTNSFDGFRKYKDDCLVSEGIVDGEKIILVKPQTFMNRSGKPVRSLLSFYKLDPEKSLIVIGDDADISIGTIRSQKGKSSAGHKGVQSIIDEVGTKEFIRLRIGIDSEEEIYKTLKEEGGLENLVLKRFTDTEEELLEKVMKESAEELSSIIKGKIIPSLNKKDNTPK
jgi:PTH1 family peptidyl-tRNA hydrolase